jgi:hypothetical protein
MKRRAFIKNSGLSCFLLGMEGIPGFINKTLIALKFSLQKNKILVVIFQRGLWMD